MGSEYQEAVERVLARKFEITGAKSLNHVDGRAYVCDALTEMTPAQIHELTNQLGYAIQHGAGYAHVGKALADIVIGHLKKSPRWEGWVADEMAEMAAARREEMGEAA